MGIEQRKGNLYYYRKRRVGDRVVSEYGGGLIVSLAERQAEIEWAQRDSATAAL